jgi:hypothetical protein
MRANPLTRTAFAAMLAVPGMAVTGLALPAVAPAASAQSLAQTQAPVTATPRPPPGVPPGTSPTTGARPGNQVGSGMSMPMSGSASNIGPNDTRSQVAPNLPAPPLAENSPPSAYLRAAQGSLATGRTGEAQQALEMAQTRLLDRSVPYGQTNDPSSNPAVVAINRALQALAAGDRATSMAQIQAALANTP